MHITIRKLIFLSQNANGYFTASLLSYGDSESKQEKPKSETRRQPSELRYFHAYKRQHPEFFRVVHQVGERSVQLYQTTEYFCDYHGLEEETVQLDDPSSILSHLAWAAFIIEKKEQSLARKLPKQPFHFKNKLFSLDNFDERLEDNLSQVYITFDFRIGKIRTNGARAMVPKPANCRQFKILLNDFNATYFEKVDDVFSDESLGIKRKSISKNSSSEALPVQISPDEIVEDGFLPADESSCHKDKRSYPGLKKKQSGAEKMRLDLEYRQNRTDMPEDYKFGVYKEDAINIEDHLLPGGILPTQKDEIHSDKRKYPGAKDPMFGTTKWKLDQEILQKKKKFVQGWKFGLWPKDKKQEKE